MGTPQELTGDCGNVVWCNYEFAWGGRYTHHYTSQSLNGCAILETDLQPIRFQGQFYDVETGLHYNRFRYYDSDVGMFIQRDPIGLLGGVNVYQYADDPIHFIDPFGLKKAPKSLPNEPGIYIITNKAANKSYVGSAGIIEGGQGMNDRVSSTDHKNAQKLLEMDGTVVQFISVDFDGTKLTNSQRNNILRKYEQREYDKQKAKGFEMLNDPNKRIQALKKVESTDKLVRDNNIKAGSRRTTCK